MKNEIKGTILALLAAIVSGIAIPVNKLFIVHLDPLVFTGVRAIIIGIIFLALSLYQSRSRHQKFKKVSWKYLISIAVIGGAFAFILFFSGLQLTTAGKAAFLQKTLPMYVAVFAFLFLREKITKKMLYAIIAMLIGTALIYVASTPVSQLWSAPSVGDLLVIGATILWAIEAIIAKKAMILGEENFVVSFARMFFGGLIIFGVIILFGRFGSLFTISLHVWINILISAALLFAYVLFYYWAIKHINVTKVASLLLLAPIISAIGGLLIFSETFPPLQIVGSALILIGAYFLTGVKSEFREKI